MFDWGQLNPEVIAEFRANEGRVARFGALPLVILHTVGARTGRVREVPLIVVPDGEQTLIFGTNAGSPTHPVWVHNLRAHPRIEVEGGRERFLADVLELPEAAAAEKRRIQSEATPQFAEYVASAAPRVVPVFSIVRV